MIEFTDETGKLAIDSENMVIIDMYADWCGPCKTLTPTLNKLSSKFENVKFGKLNVDDYVDLVEEYKIRNIPTVLFFKEGNMVDKFVGNIPEQHIEEKIHSLMTR